MSDDPQFGFSDLDTYPAPPRYRAFVLEQDGRVLEVISFWAADDDDAHDKAQGIDNRHTVELWDGLRFMASFNQKS